jgi:outer membrane protein OmpA-like peptidoglycan-associated protein
MLRGGLIPAMLMAALLAAPAAVDAKTKKPEAEAPATAAPPSGKGDSYNIGSIASQFLQSKARITVLEHDDVVAASCQDKHFTKAAPFGTVESGTVGGVSEKKWTEVWTLARCGTDVFYMIFFTEEGIGGAFYSLLGPNASADFSRYATATAAAPPPPREFIVYFAYAKTSLSREAEHILDAVVKAAKETGSTKLAVKGHADTVGSVATNLRVSEERAKAVEQYLVKHGIPAANIAASGKGKTDLKVPTSDQVREQENRNVRIELK